MTAENGPYRANIAHVRDTFSGALEDVVTGDVHLTRIGVGENGEPVIEHYERPRGGELVSKGSTPFEIPKT